MGKVMFGAILATIAFAILLSFFAPLRPEDSGIGELSSLPEAGEKTIALGAICLGLPLCAAFVYGFFYLWTLAVGTGGRGYTGIEEIKIGERGFDRESGLYYVDIATSDSSASFARRLATINAGEYDGLPGATRFVNLQETSPGVKGTTLHHWRILGTADPKILARNAAWAWSQANGRIANEDRIQTWDDYRGYTQADISTEGGRQPRLARHMVTRHRPGSYSADRTVEIDSTDTGCAILAISFIATLAIEIAIWFIFLG